MNRTRVAALLRELADELEGDEAPAPQPTRRPTPPRRPRPVAQIEVDEMTRARARKVLRRAGVVAS